MTSRGSLPHCTVFFEKLFFASTPNVDFLFDRLQVWHVCKSICNIKVSCMYLPLST
jgi:hypothetical protein